LLDRFCPTLVGLHLLEQLLAHRFRAAIDPWQPHPVKSVAAGADLPGQK